MWNHVCFKDTSKKKRFFCEMSDILLSIYCRISFFKINKHELVNFAHNKANIFFASSKLESYSYLKVAFTNRILNLKPLFFALWTLKTAQSLFILFYKKFFTDEWVQKHKFIAYRLIKWYIWQDGWWKFNLSIQHTHLACRQDSLHKDNCLVKQQKKFSGIIHYAK